MHPIVRLKIAQLYDSCPKKLSKSFGEELLAQIISPQTILTQLANKIEQGEGFHLILEDVIEELGILCRKEYLPILIKDIRGMPVLFQSSKGVNRGNEELAFQIVAEMLAGPVFLEGPDKNYYYSDNNFIMRMTHGAKYGSLVGGYYLKGVIEEYEDFNEEVLKQDVLKLEQWIQGRAQIILSYALCLTNF